MSVNVATTRENFNSSQKCKLRNRAHRMHCKSFNLPFSSKFNYNILYNTSHYLRFVFCPGLSYVINSVFVLQKLISHSSYLEFSSEDACYGGVSPLFNAPISFAVSSIPGKRSLFSLKQFVHIF